MQRSETVLQAERRNAAAEGQAKSLAARELEHRQPLKEVKPQISS